MSGRAKNLARAPAQPGFALDSHIFYLFTQILGRRNRHLQETLKPLGIGVPQWRVLATLQECPGCTMNALADLTTVDRTTLTRTLDRMVHDRLVARRSDAQDRRSVRLYLTPAGEAAFRQVLPRVIAQNERAVSGFSAEERTAFRTLLHRMVRNLDPDYDRRNAPRLSRRVGPAPTILRR